MVSLCIVLKVQTTFKFGSDTIRQVDKLFHVLKNTCVATCKTRISILFDTPAIGTEELSAALKLKCTAFQAQHREPQSLMKLALYTVVSLLS